MLQALLFFGLRILILVLLSYIFEYSSYNAFEQSAVQPSCTGTHGQLYSKPTPHPPKKIKLSNQTHFRIKHPSR